MQLQHIIKESFGNFKYTPPTRKDYKLYDFYMLNLIRGRSKSELTAYKTTAKKLPATLDKFDPNDIAQSHTTFSPGNLDNKETQVNYMIEEVTETLLPNLKHELENVLIYAAASELKNVLKLNDPDIVAMQLTQTNFANLAHTTEQYLKKIRKASPDNCYKLALEIYKQPKNFMELAKYIFENLEFTELHGGPAWGRIVEAYFRLTQATKPPEMFVAIDHVYDLQHNTGTIFNKITSYASNTGYDWLKQALDYKAIIKHPSDLLDHVSPEMRKLAQLAIQIKKL